MNRRQFTQAGLLAGTGSLLGCTGLHLETPPGSNPEPLAPLPDPAHSGIDHIVAVTMENRSFDHFFGWMPNADGRQDGLTYLDPDGVPHATHSLSGNYTGCPGSDPDHSYAGGRLEFNNGKMDGFLLDTANDPYCIGYYGAEDNPFYASLARAYTTCDRYFVSFLGPTIPNRMFIHAAQTDRLTNDGGLSNVPTIWDSLAAAGISRAYYYNNVPYITLWGQKYLDITRTFSQFQDDAANGTLPSVSFVDPRFTLLDDGTGADHHPHADIRNGDKFLYDVFRAVSTGPGWSGTVLIINFDEWGGFFDHVPPPRAQAANQTDTDIIDGKTLLGMRIPVVVASPWSIGDPTNPTVNSLVFDHTSVLKLIEWRWGLQPLTPRDASNDIDNLAHTLNFLKPQPSVPPLPEPQTPASVPPCNGGPGDLFQEDSESTRSSAMPFATARKFSAGAEKSALWSEMRSIAQNNGFAVE